MAEPQLFLPHRKFNETTGSYVKEYDYWRSQRPFPSLLGVFQLSSDEYCNTTDEELLALAGHADKTIIGYNPDPDATESYYTRKPDTPIGAHASGVRAPDGGVHSIVFIRENVLRPVAISDPVRGANYDAMVKLGVLFHEFGHAEDIENSRNYNHDGLLFDKVPGETYAHACSINHLKAFGYFGALDIICTSIEFDLKRDDNDIYRRAAECVAAMFDLPALKKVCADALLPPPLPQREIRMDDFPLQLRPRGRSEDFRLRSAKRRAGKDRK